MLAPEVFMTVIVNVRHTRRFNRNIIFVLFCENIVKKKSLKFFKKKKRDRSALRKLYIFLYQPIIIHGHLYYIEIDLHTSQQ